MKLIDHQSPTPMGKEICIYPSKWYIAWWCISGLKLQTKAQYVCNIMSDGGGWSQLGNGWSAEYGGTNNNLLTKNHTHTNLLVRYKLGHWFSQNILRGKKQTALHNTWSYFVRKIKWQIKCQWCLPCHSDSIPNR